MKDLNGLSADELKNSLSEKFSIEPKDSAYRPESLHDFGMYLEGKWYKMTSKPGTYNDGDPIGVLDVTILSDNVLDPILGIKDQRTDNRIDFFGVIRGLG